MLYSLRSLRLGPSSSAPSLPASTALRVIPVQLLTTTLVGTQFRRAACSWTRGWLLALFAEVKARFLELQAKVQGLRQLVLPLPGSAVGEDGIKTSCEVLRAAF